MYGIVNKAIEELVLQEFGADAWQRVKVRSGVDHDFFISNQSYPDGDTYKLAGAVSEETGMSLEAVLVRFGEFWVLKTGIEKYGGLMKAGGPTLEVFLLNLPAFHNRIMLIYPKLQPPEFRVRRLGHRSVAVQYYSHRSGLHHFVQGLLQGLAKLYDTAATVRHVYGRSEAHDHDEFHVNW